MLSTSAAACGSVVLHPHPGGTAGAQAVQGALEDQPAGAHHADVGADLLDLGEQVRGDEHGGPSVAISRTSARTSLVPCGSRPLVGSSRMISSRGCEQARRDGQPLLHAERVGAVALLRRGQQPDPVQRGVDPGAGGARVGGRVGGVERARFARPERNG